MTKLLVKALQKLRILSKFNLVSSTKLNNNSFKIPIINGIGPSNLNISEFWMIELLKKVFPHRSGTFLDVGVNIGQTLLKVKSIDNQRQYLGIEPNPNCLFYLQHLVSLNQFKNTNILPVGVSDNTALCELLFFNQDSSDSSASMIKDYRDERTVVKREYIPVMNLGQISKDIKMDDIGIIKIDVEGAELEVLSSLQPLIQKNQPIILIEILPAYTNKNHIRIDRQQKIESIFKELNYSIFRVIKNGSNFSHLEKLTEFGIHSNLEFCDYAIIPSNLEL